MHSESVDEAACDYEYGTYHCTHPFPPVAPANGYCVCRLLPSHYDSLNYILLWLSFYFQYKRYDSFCEMQSLC